METTAPGQRHILAINNSVDVLALFAELLQDEGYRVSTRTYVDKDLNAIEELAPDLIILDYMWAAEDFGWSLLQMLRMNRGTADMPIILCTGALAHVRETENHLMTMKIEVVYKPFQIDHLLDVIQRVLAAKGETVPTH